MPSERPVADPLSPSPLSWELTTNAYIRVEACIVSAVFFCRSPSQLANDSYDLTLSVFTAGARYLHRLGHSPLQPFGQVLVGVAHSNGSLVEGPNPAASNSGAAFAANVGGGVDLRANRRLSFRLIDADYLITTFDNGDNDHQNNLRISAGIVLHF